MTRIPGMWTTNRSDLADVQLSRSLSASVRPTKTFHHRAGYNGAIERGRLGFYRAQSRWSVTSVRPDARCRVVAVANTAAETSIQSQGPRRPNHADDGNSARHSRQDEFRSFLPSAIRSLQQL